MRRGHEARSEATESRRSSDDGATRRQYKTSDERRNEIIEATLAILSEQGLHACTTSALAARVGVSEATLFRHFESKDAILIAALRHQIRTLRQRIRSYRGTGGPWERARGLVQHVLEFVDQTAGGPLIIMTGQAIRILPAIRDDVNATRRLFSDRLEALIRDELSTGERRDLDPAHVAELTVAIVHSVGLRWIVSEGTLPLRETGDAMLDVVACCVTGEPRGRVEP